MNFGWHPFEAFAKGWNLKCELEMEKANNILLKILGLVLITAAVMKGWQLLTEPVAGRDIWTNRAFLIFTVEFELALGIWLLSGIFKKLAWLAATACFTLFTILTLYKGITGADSCGCFGAVKVSPWLTLFVVDLPALALLFMFVPILPKAEKLLIASRHFHFMFHLIVVILCSTFVMVFYGVDNSDLENFSIAKGYEYNLRESILIKRPIEAGYKLVLIYRRNCSSCIRAIIVIEQMLSHMTNKGSNFEILLIEIPPVGTQKIKHSEFVHLGLLVNSRNKKIDPTIIFMKNNFVFNRWNVEDFNFENAMEIISFVNVN